MKITNIAHLVLSVVAIVVGLALSPLPVHAQEEVITPDDLIYLVNTIRTANGLPALRVDSILMSTAQNTAETMAAENLTWHIGKPGERIADAGYGSGYNVWATENFAMSWGAYTLADIQQEWADATHMIPMVNPAYCDIGAGVASAADGTVYYIVHAAYTSAGACGNYQSPNIEAQSNPLQNNPTQAPLGDIDATFEYEVALGDTLWSIAIANDTTVAFIKQINDLDSDEIFIGQVLELPLPPDQIPTLTPTLQPSATALARQGTPTNAMVPTQETPSVTVTETAQPTLMSTPEPSAEPPAAQRSNPALIWQVIAGVEFLALVVITFFFWKPWRKPLPESQEHEPHTWQEPE